MAALGTRQLTLSVGGTDYTAQITNTEILSAAAEQDDQTFAEAAAGGARDYKLKGRIVQDLATGTLWDKVWSSAGTTAAYLLKPYGNATASATQPHYSGNVVISEPDGTLLGGDANSSATARWFVEVEWAMTAKPTKVTA